tara:strand:+ start:86 stop:298 length:213 start_codon:yes stop_codon:yes gene_type:complete
MNEKVERLKRGVAFAKEHIEESDFNRAVILSVAVLEQMVAMIEKRCLDQNPDGDVIVAFDKDGGDGQVES